jgi:hypothetical protein
MQTQPTNTPTQPLPGTEETKSVTTATADSFWDDPTIRPPSSEYAKFLTVGDTFGGTIAKLTKKAFDVGTAEERVAPVIMFTEEDAPSITAGQYMLQQALFELRPVVGDKLTVTLTKIIKQGLKTHKRFRVELTRTATGQTETIDQTEN